jgi:hypothetical protein
MSDLGLFLMITAANDKEGNSNASQQSSLQMRIDASLVAAQTG